MNKTWQRGKTYFDQASDGYILLHKSGSGSVLVFEDMDGFRRCRHESGMYRWDDKETQMDIQYGL